MSDRQTAMKEFLARTGWGDAVLAPISADASTRRYVRLALGEKRALVMDQPQESEAPSQPEGASDSKRLALGYNALARLAGGDCARFVAVASYLRARGFSAPQIEAADYRNGFVLLEDLGDGLFAHVLKTGIDERSLYKSAVEVLARLHAETAPSHLTLPDTPGNGATNAPGAASRHLALHAYDLTALTAETDLLGEWFLPLALGRGASREEMGEQRALWNEALGSLKTERPVFIHRDYHAQNLLWLPRRNALLRVGLIDFQDAVAGSSAYDLISLLEDARRDVSPQLAGWATQVYLDALGREGLRLDEQQFRQEMAVMAAQRNAKIVGIFARLYRRDAKPGYLRLLPRVWRHLERDLEHPALARLKQWYDRVIPQQKRVLAPVESL